MNKLQNITGRIIINSKGLYTIEAQALFTNGQIVKASIPAGTSTGSKEAKYVRNDKAVELIIKYGNQLQNFVARKASLKDVHKFLKTQDNTLFKEKLGANTFLVLEILYIKIMSYLNREHVYNYINRELFEYIQKPSTFPTPLFNIINGGLHAKNGLPFQEFWIIPKGIKTISAQINAGVVIYSKLKEILMKKGYSTLTGLEGGFAPTLKNGIQESLDLISEAIYKSGYSLGEQIMLGMDAAATDFVIIKDDITTYPIFNNKPPLTHEEYVRFWSNLVNNYPILLVEDPLSETTPLSLWAELKESLGLNYVSLIGDDLTVTNKSIVQNAIAHKAIDGSIIKPNQIGSLIEALETVFTLRKNNAISIVSHRSGETNDDFIADFAYAIASNYIKAGAPAHGERVAKYNRLLEIDIQNP